MDNRNGKIVAIKKLNDGKYNALKEISILSKLSTVENPHPNIACFYRGFKDIKSGNYYLVTEYINGCNLFDAIRSYSNEGARKEKYLYDMTIKLLKTLKYIHKKNIVHGDISYKNILVVQKEPFLIDFGLSRDITIIPPKMDVSGTPVTIDPVLLKEKVKKPYNDTWSLGITIIVVLEEYTWDLSEKKTVTTLLKEIYDDNYTPQLNVKHQKLNILVNNMLIRDPKKRKSASQLLKL